MLPGRNRDLRIGTSERDLVMVLLGEHMSAGRLEIAEYEQRCSRAAEARYRSEVADLFSDLPAPHPEFKQSPLTEKRLAAKPVALGIGALVVLVAVVAKQLWLLALLLVVLVVLARRRR